MAPYLLLAAVPALAGVFLCRRPPSRAADALLYGVSFAAMLGLSVFRAPTVGVDYEMYLSYFGKVCRGGLPFLLDPGNPYRDEPGYGLLNWVLSLFGESALVFAAGVSLLMLGLAAAFLWRHCPIRWMGLFLFVSFGFFGYTLCTIRHQIAISVFLFALPRLREGRFLPYLALALLAASFHKSMLLWIPVYFLARLPLDRRAYLFYGGCLVLYFFFSEPVLEFITRFVYTGYQPGSYYLRGRDLPTVLIPLLYTGAVLGLRAPLLRRDPEALPLLNLSLYCGCLFVMTLKHFVFQRFALVLLPVSMVLLPELCLCLGPEPGELGRLEELRAEGRRGGGGREAARRRYAALRGELREKRRLFLTGVGFVLFFGFLYLGWLLSSNRLLLVPYRFIKV